MQRTQTPPSARPDNSTADKKRKLNGRQQPNVSTADSAPGPKQQTISELFSASQQKPSVWNSNDRPLSPSNKRIKLDHPREPQSPTPPNPAMSNLTPEKMYSFTSKNSTNNNVIDLTKSPSPSPQPRKNGVRAYKPTFNPHAGAKRLVVKNFRTTPRVDPQQYFNQVWERLDSALSAIFNEEKVTFSLEELYRGVENLCRQGHAAELLSRLRERSKQHIAKRLKEPLLEKTSSKDVDILRAVIVAWSAWQRQLKTIHWIFCYLDRAYLLRESQSLQEIAVGLFRSIIFDDVALQHKVIDGACDLVAADRNDEDVDTKTLSDAIGMFHEMTTYTSAFEPRLLELSQTYVVNWADLSSSEENLPSYVEHSEDLMKKEMNRCDLFNLDSTTKRALLTLLETYLIEQKVDRLTNQDDVADLLDDNNVHSLEQLFMLLERRRLGVKLKQPFEKWIDDTGTAIVFDDKAQDEMVVRLLGLKKRLDAICRVSFHRNTELGHALRGSFEGFINKTKKSSSTWNTDNSKPAEMIAKYVDTLLRGGAKAIPGSLSAPTKRSTIPDPEDVDESAFDEDTRVNHQLDQVLDLFRFVHGKAVFEAFYKKDLAKRLLLGRSASADAERSMLTRLKTECGAGFTQNLEQMFKDVELAREEMSAYKNLIEERGEKLPIDLSVHILSASAWPSFPDIPVIIPADIKAAGDKFETHYKSKHSGRKLDWKHALAHCQMRANFPKGKKEFVVSSFQAIVLLLFNRNKEGQHLTYESIKAETGLPEAEVKRTLQSLACAKVRPLSKHPKGRDINDTDTFTLNLNFTHEKYRIKINQVQLRETKEENKETHERVAADRNFETQAAIVRIMKSRKNIGHSELVAEVIQATKTRGVLPVADIKRNIDRLIDKEYMEREENGQYSYIA